MLRNIISNDFFTILLMVSLMLVAAAKALSTKRFNDFFTVLGNSKYLKIYSKEQKFLDRFDALLFANLIISTSLFAFISYRFFANSDTISLDMMFKITFGICGYLLIKMIVERLIGGIFEMDAVIDQYLFQKISYKNYLGVALIPMNALLLYTLNPTLPFFYATAIFVFIIVLTGLFTSIKAHQSLIKYNFLYFILYLCALEVVPYIILYKMLVSK